MIVYMLRPIDTWYGWTRFGKTLERPSPVNLDDFCVISVAALQNAYTRAQQLAKQLGWSGSLCQGPFFCPLPENYETPTAFLLAWKEGGTGIAYVASPYHLPWLDSDCFDQIDDTWRRGRDFNRDSEKLG